MRVRPITDSDVRFLYAAYKEGGFADLIMPDLPPQTFQDRIEALLGSVEYDWVLETDKPIGLVMGRAIAAGRGVEVQVDWMPWASTRNKLEGSAVFFREISKHLKIFIFADEESEPFWRRFCQYRMLRNGCRVLNHFAGGRHAQLFYTTGPT